MDTFSMRLKAIMKEKGVTQKQLAEQLHMTRQAVSLYMTGHSLPTIDKLLTITDYFDVSADYLIGKTDVRTQGADVNMICEYTGLSEKAVETLHDLVSSQSNSSGDELYMAVMIVMVCLLDRIIEKPPRNGNPESGKEKNL